MIRFLVEVCTEQRADERSAHRTWNEHRTNKQRGWQKSHIWDISTSQPDISESLQQLELNSSTALTSPIITHKHFPDQLNYLPQQLHQSNLAMSVSLVNAFCMPPHTIRRPSDLLQIFDYNQHNVASTFNLNYSIIPAHHSTLWTLSHFWLT